VVFAVNRQCTATAKRSGERCQLPAVTGYEVCRVHGGKTPRGMANGNTKHGRYSKDLPTQLSSRFQDSINDPALMQLNHEAALLTTRIGDLLSSVELPHKDNMFDIVNARDGIRYAMQSGKGDDLVFAFEQLDTAVNIAISDSATWAEINKTIEQYRKVVETATKIDMQSERAISIEQFMLLMGAIFKTIETIVRSQDERIAVATEIRKLLEIGNE
jgi:hypothetical protein